jgi:branched-chain amino acid transport system substrate-binding protein
LGRGALGALAFATLALGAFGCGGGGVARNATVSVYLSAPMSGAQGTAGRAMCAAARRELSRHGGRAGDLKLRLVCLDAGEADGRWTLARVGANARRAIEDSTTVAYIGEPERRARLQSRPILESAGVAETTASSGSTAMRRIIAAVAEANSGALRDSVREALEAS